jgi:hypothetical protein
MVADAESALGMCKTFGADDKANRGDYTPKMKVRLAYIQLRTGC